MYAKPFRCIQICVGTAKCDEVDLGRDQKDVQQQDTGVAGASKPQCQGHRRAQGWHSLGLASLLGIDPPLCSGSRGSSVGVVQCFEPVSPSGSSGPCEEPVSEGNCLCFLIYLQTEWAAHHQLRVNHFCFIERQGWTSPHNGKEVPKNRCPDSSYWCAEQRLCSFRVYFCQLCLISLLSSLLDYNPGWRYGTCTLLLPWQPLKFVSENIPGLPAKSVMPCVPFLSQSTAAEQLWIPYVAVSRQEM